MKFRILIQPDEDGVFVAECPSLPGCISQGDNREEALANISDAIIGGGAHHRGTTSPSASARFF